MRFTRYGRCEFTDTKRKRAAIRRKQRREREALPLFAEQIASEQPAEDDVMVRRQTEWEAHTQRQRDRQAQDWRRARGRLQAYPVDVRQLLLDNWNHHRWLPGTPTYLLDMLWCYDAGKLDLSSAGEPARPAGGTITPADVVRGG